ncbi:unnamed protein product [Adineta ricciae]|uniref:EGF-like domain-containing protein n=1 Tax=Adineta ricciae TaxID=249248 RepID=A0A814CJQ6_ADIRI|nr:unnamed protein product [Adineta ricciae]
MIISNGISPNEPSSECQSEENFWFCDLSLRIIGHIDSFSTVIRPYPKMRLISFENIDFDKDVWLCNQGYSVLLNNKFNCLCSPSYHGNYCPYQSERLTVFLEIRIAYYFNPATDLMGSEYGIVRPGYSMLSTYSSLPPGVKREYYFRRNSPQCEQPSVERHSNSQAMGVVANVNDNWWQKTADDLVNVAKVAGQIVKLVLKQSIEPDRLGFVVWWVLKLRLGSVEDSYCAFSFDETYSARKFHDLIDSLKAFGGIQMTCDIYQETPRVE